MAVFRRRDAGTYLFPNGCVWRLTCIRKYWKRLRLGKWHFPKVIKLRYNCIITVINRYSKVPGFFYMSIGVAPRTFSRWYTVKMIPFHTCLVRCVASFPQTFNNIFYPIAISWYHWNRNKRHSERQHVDLHSFIAPVGACQSTICHEM